MATILGLMIMNFVFFGGGILVGWSYHEFLNSHYPRK